MLELGIVLPADQTWGGVLPPLVQEVFNWTLYRPAVMGARRSLRRVSSTCRAKCTLQCMSETLPITEARARFGSLVRRASHARERITITDHGQPAAVLINPQELADIEDALALAQYRARQAAGETTGVPNDRVRARLGLERAS